MSLNKKIKELDHATLITGDMKIPIHNPNTDKTEYITVSEIQTQSGTGIPQWDSETAYNEDDVVVSDDQLWISQQDDNENVLPGTDDDYWLPGVKSTVNTLWNPGVYTDSLSIVYKIIGTKLYTFRINTTTPFNSSDFEAELIDGLWDYIAGPEQAIEIDTSTSVITLDVLLLQ